MRYEFTYTPRVNKYEPPNLNTAIPHAPHARPEAHMTGLLKAVDGLTAQNARNQELDGKVARADRGIVGRTRVS